MITDAEIEALYRCLLGRAPETPDTIAAFRAYYPAFELGRRAVLNSAEFTRIAARDSGAGMASTLARAFLRRAGGGATPAPSADPALREAMHTMIRAHGEVRLAVVIGDPSAPVADLVAGTAAAMLHIAPGFPAFVPQSSALTGDEGSLLFRLACDPAGLACFLAAEALRIDLLTVLDGDAAWWEGLRPALNERAILLSRAAPPDWPGLEAPVALPAGLTARHQGGWFLPVSYTPPQVAEDEAPPIAGLAIAAIVRNEEVALLNMLASVMPVAGSIAVLDTGSTDGTMACAEAFLAGSSRPWTVRQTQPGRFDAMRNAALDLVDDSADWVLMLDADEELCREDRDALRLLLSGAEADAYALPRYNYQGQDKTAPVAPYPDRQVRLLRRRTAVPVRYSGAVHETVRDVPVTRLPLDASALGGGRGGPHIHHLVRRFRSPEAEARKQAYYLAMAAAHENA